MLKFENVNKSYKKKQVLFDVSFEIKQGSFVGLVGNNGAGKTTLIKSIFGETSIDSGSINLNNKNIINSDEISKLSFFPDTNSLKLDINLNEYLLYIATLNQIENKEDVIKKITDLLKISPYMKKDLKHLSSGWKKRAIMAACLITKPEIIIFDEPTANLDLDSKLEFQKIFKLLNNMGITIIITSHIIEELQNAIDHLIILKNGVITYDQVFDNKLESIKEIYTDANGYEEVNYDELQSLFK